MTAHRVESSLRCLNSYAQDFVSHLVIHPSAFLQLRGKNVALAVREIDTVLEGFYHRGSIH